MPARKKIRFWNMQSKSPAAELEKEDKHVCHTEIDGTLSCNEF